MKGENFTNSPFPNSKYLTFDFWSATVQHCLVLDEGRLGDVNNVSTAPERTGMRKKLRVVKKKIQSNPHNAYPSVDSPRYVL